MPGVTNGIDADDWDPTTDKHIAKTYSADDMAGKVGAVHCLVGALTTSSTARLPCSPASWLADAITVSVTCSRKSRLLGFHSCSPL